ncbi:hypothetical protein [Curtobacterium sp. MCBD17_030]|uniref:hypothetical protein n=1 Tax=Curtobacterium sp. MCBD17_030 TaxID=2175649 RepID=UPI000D9A9B97|nr:hypothetical protein [Curtobacterium sp. MCBD17_030]PYY32264.1 hypothetical protein DEI89_13640 [Curtobacterium sp. MCBD17_030]
MSDTLLNRHDAFVSARALRTVVDDWARDPEAFGDSDKDARNELRDRADRYVREAPVVHAGDIDPLHITALLADAAKYTQPSEHMPKDTLNYELVRKLAATINALTGRYDTAPAIVVPVQLIDDVMGSADSVSDPDDPIELLYALAHPEQDD